MGIVTDGLIGYWHYQQGVSGSTWENIAPATKGQYNGQINGPVVVDDGMYFDGVDDGVNFENLGLTSSFAVEFIADFLGENGYILIQEFTHRIGFLNTGVVQSIFNGGGFTNSLSGKVVSNNRYHVLFRYNKEQSREELFVNNSLVATSTGRSSTNLNVPFKMANEPKNTNKYKGGVSFLRIYSKYVSNEEIDQNYSVGTSIGLTEEPPVSNPPAVTIVNINAPTADNTLSDEPNMDRATITFKFDQDVTEWRVRTVGTDPETGILADSGGAVSAGTEITAEVDWTELYGEGQNRVNIYGKNANGQWTPYG